MSGHAGSAKGHGEYPSRQDTWQVVCLGGGPVPIFVPA